jgi:glycosyltransferase involved in cell wall biosynthesis
VIIVVDDGSSDGSAAMLTQAYGGLIRLIEQANGGAAAARNTGVQNATGALVAFLDSDDVWGPGKLATQLEALASAPAVLNYTNYRLGEGGRDKFAMVDLRLPTPYARFERPLELLTRWSGAGVHLSGTLCVRQALLDAGPFDTRLRVAEDTKLFYALARLGAFSVLGLPLWTRNQTIDSVTLTVQADEAYQREHAQAIVPILEALLGEEAGRGTIVRRNLRRLLAHFAMKQAKFQARDGRLAEARRRAVESLAYDPFGRAALRSVLLAVAPATASHLMSRRVGG